MRTQNNFDDYVKQRLVAWAEWFSRGCDSGLGFMRKNVLQRLREEGGVLINGTGAKCSPGNTNAEEIENLVKLLAEHQPKRAQVLRICYFYPVNPVEKAKHSGYSSAQYYLQLKLAHEWINGYLCAWRKR